ncbi:MAG: AMP-binding protein, partial [Clostridia bacterium]|nr:AMP-binding protein [Clostridia bacterium]
MEQITGLDYKIQEMARRIRELREIEGYTIAEMAEKTDVTAQEYMDCEEGRSDLNFAFIYRCAMALKVNVTDIIEGYSPKLRSYTVTRSGAGQEIASAHGMTYYNMAYDFRNRIAEPLFVKIDYNENAAHKDIELTTHTGQECDIVIEGQLMVQIGEHREILGPGDSIYYNSETPHGMIATGGKDCTFYAIVLNPSGEPIAELMPTKAVTNTKLVAKKDTKERIWHNYIDVTENDNGHPTSITFKNTAHFNFAFDLVDALADREPGKLAMLHVSKDKTERRFTFKDMKRESNRCANYFKSIGIKRGDRVMLVLKRHYQFWFAMIGLHKLGAIAIPAVNQLQEHDFEYRFQAAGVSAILCTADDDVAHQIDLAAEKCPTLTTKILVNGKREGWRSFDEEYTMYSTHYNRPDDAPGGEDLMLMYFTSGTSGYPKIAAHNYKYVLGHFHTAKYW